MVCDITYAIQRNDAEIGFYQRVLAPALENEPQIAMAGAVDNGDDSNDNQPVVAAGAPVAANPSVSDKPKVVLYINTDNKPPALKLVDLRKTMNQILAKNKVDIEIVFRETTRTNKKELQIGHYTSFGKKYFGALVRFSTSNPKTGLAANMNRNEIVIYVEKLEKEILDAGQRISSVLDRTDIYANILLHEALFHGVHNGKDKKGYAVGTLFSTISPITHHVIIPADQAKTILKAFK